MRIKIPLFVVSLLLYISLAQTVFAAKPPKPTPPPTVKSVCIDAGHGGSDAGTSYLDLTEKEVNLEVAEMLEEKLLASGYEVFMARTDNDTNLSNADRYNFCNENKASILISIHHNGSTNQTTDYSRALYMKKSDVALAQEVVNSVSNVLVLTNSGISRFASGVLLKSTMSSTISEAFFLTNSDEYALIKNGNRLKQEADGLFTAIQKYLN